MADPLETVLRLRRRGVDEVRQRLAASLAVATAADAEAREAENAIEAEARRASDPEGDDNLVEAFAAWLPGARHRAAQARAVQERHQAEVDRHRAELAACRAALEAIEGLVAQRRAEAEAAAARRAQNEMDEVAARKRFGPA